MSLKIKWSISTKFFLRLTECVLCVDRQYLTIYLTIVICMKILSSYEQVTYIRRKGIFFLRSKKYSDAVFLRSKLKVLMLIDKYILC